MIKVILGKVIPCVESFFKVCTYLKTKDNEYYCSKNITINEKLENFECPHKKYKV